MGLTGEDMEALDLDLIIVHFSGVKKEIMIEDLTEKLL